MCLPIKISKDNEYFAKLKESFEENIKELKANKENKILVDKVSKTQEEILISIEEYYNGDINKATKRISDILKTFNNDIIVVTALKDNFALNFYRFLSEQNKEHFRSIHAEKFDFFKARVGTSCEEYTRSDMLHIPLSSREKVSTQRFSIPGVPCIYLATSSYCCWIEMGKPESQNFYVSAFEIKENENIKVLNLAVSQNDIFQINERLSTGERKTYNGDSLEEIREKLIKIYPLVIATSFKVTQSDRVFKSEYIISQLIMMTLRELKIDAISYFSKQTYDDNPICVNLAIPTRNTSSASDPKLSDICDKLVVKQSINMREFQMLDNISKLRPKRSGYNRETYIEQDVFYDLPFAIAGKFTEYRTSVFHQYDKYLVNSKEIK